MAIVEKYQNKKGWWIVRNTINAGRAIFLKFDHDPTQAEANSATVNLLNAEIAENKLQKRINYIKDFLAGLEKDLIDFLEANPAATKADVINELKAYVQAGKL